MRSTPAPLLTLLALAPVVALAHQGLCARTVNLSEIRECETTFTTMARERSAGVVLVPSFLFVTLRSQVAELGIKRRLPVISWTDALSGALISYGPSSFEIHRRAGEYVAKIFNGAKPGELPVEQPSKLALIVNLKTATALGLKMPQTVILQADKVIE